MWSIKLCSLAKIVVTSFTAFTVSIPVVIAMEMPIVLVNFTLSITLKRLIIMNLRKPIREISPGVVKNMLRVTAMNVIPKNNGKSNGLINVGNAGIPRGLAKGSNSSISPLTIKTKQAVIKIVKNVSFNVLNENPEKINTEIISQRVKLLPDIIVWIKSVTSAFCIGAKALRQIFRSCPAAQNPRRNIPEFFNEVEIELVVFSNLLLSKKNVPILNSKENKV